MKYHTDYMTTGDPDCPHAVWVVNSRHESSTCEACGAVKEVIMTARVDRYRLALEDVIAADCCGCSAYPNIARTALGLDDEAFQQLKARGPRE